MNIRFKRIVTSGFVPSGFSQWQPLNLKEASSEPPMQKRTVKNYEVLLCIF